MSYDAIYYTVGFVKSKHPSTMPNHRIPIASFRFGWKHFVRARLDL